MIVDKVSDINAVHRTVNSLVTRACDPYDTGFVGCQYKRELLELKWYIEDALERCPQFGHIEDEWHQQRTLELLKK